MKKIKDYLVSLMMYIGIIILVVGLLIGIQMVVPDGHITLTRGEVIAICIGLVILMGIGLKETFRRD